MSLDKETAALSEAIEQYKDEMAEALQALVRIPSVAGDEGAAQEYMYEQYKSLGLDTIRLVADRSKLVNHPAFCDYGTSYEGRPNIIGILKGDPSKNSMVLNGHIDVVPPNPVEQWKHDPWGGDIEGNRLYGRGADDMKAGLIANIFALKALYKTGLKPQGTVMLQSVIEEEEGGGGGALACMVEGYVGDGMIVTEPVPWLAVARAGVVRCSVRVKGKSAHPYQSHIGVSAASKMIPIFRALEELDAKRKATVHFPLFEKNDSPACHLVIGTFNAGKWIAMVPGEAEIRCRIGFIPGESAEEIRSLIEATVKSAADKDPWLVEHPPAVEWLPFFAEPHYQDPNHPFVKMVMALAQKVAGSGTKVEEQGMTGTDDARFSSNFGLPAVSFGPHGGNDHGVDEYVELDSVAQTAKAVALATLNWCSQEKSRD